jgi:hypothetical protein
MRLVLPLEVGELAREVAYRWVGLSPALAVIGLAIWIGRPFEVGERTILQRPELQRVENKRCLIAHVREVERLRVRRCGERRVGCGREVMTDELANLIDD